MRKSILYSLAFAALAFSALAMPLTAYAQNEEQSAPQAAPSSKMDQGATSGTAPEHIGKSGWTGGSTGSNTGTESGTTGSAPNINDDSQYATGADLDGPAVNFPPSKTPE